MRNDYGALRLRPKKIYAPKGARNNLQTSFQRREGSRLWFFLPSHDGMKTLPGFAKFIRGERHPARRPGHPARRQVPVRRPGPSSFRREA